jgi:tyrosyl-tRNA synthetase
VRSGLAKSGKEARRLVQEGGAKVNDEAVSDPGAMYAAGDLGAPLKLSAGKKRHALVRVG